MVHFFTAGPVDITIDYFDIDVDDRLNLSSDFSLTPADLELLAGQGIDASDISQFRFFTNQFDTNTSGIDVVATWDTEWLNGNTTWNVAYNYTDTEVTRRNPALLDNTRLREIEDGVPDTRWNLTATHQMEKLRLLARVSHFGDYFDSEAGGVFSSNTLLDLEGGYDVNANLNVVLGVRNVTDEQGDLARESGNFDFGGSAWLGIQSVHTFRV